MTHFSCCYDLWNWKSILCFTCGKWQPFQNAMQCFFFTFLCKSFKKDYVRNNNHSIKYVMFFLPFLLHISLQKHKRIWCFISGKFQKYSIAIAIFSLYIFLQNYFIKIFDVLYLENDGNSNNFILQCFSASSHFFTKA